MKKITKIAVIDDDPDIAEEIVTRLAGLSIADNKLAFQNEEKEKQAVELIIANKELAYQNDEKEKRAAELGIANIELAFQNSEKEKRAAELTIANKELAFQNTVKEKRAEELVIANKELAFQNKEKEKRAAELSIANIELAYQNDEKEKRAEELTIANKELAFQNTVKEKRAEELVIANKELAFQNNEKEKRAAELSIANKELAFQNKEKEKRAAELGIANKELAFQDDEKEKRAAELGIANKELAFQNEEKEKRAAELGIANKELVFQNDEKEKRAAELSIANKELVFQNEEKEKRAAELGIANKELAFQNNEKEKRAAELIIANKELAFQNEEKEKRAAELIIANYARSLIEASLDPLVTISATGKILDVNEASVKVTGVPRKKLIDTDFSNYFTEPKKAQEGYRQVFEKGFVADYPLTIKHKNGNLTDVLYNASVYKDDKGNVLGVFAAARDITEQKQSSQYARSLIEASLDPLVTISAAGKILDVNEASVKVTGVPREKLIDTDFSNYFTEPKKAQEGYRQVFEKGFVSDYPLTIKHKNGNLTDVLYNASVYKDDKGNVLGVFAAARDVTEQKWAKDLRIANKELAFQNDEKEKRAAEKEKRAAELIIANKELAFQNKEKEKRAAELSIANIELAYQNDEKEKRAEELTVANKELAFQNIVKEKRAEELVIANKELAFQNKEKEKRAAELSIANKELAFQNKEKEKRAAELSIANKELLFQNEEKEKRAAELVIASKELLFQNEEKEKRAAELVIANKELLFQNEEKEKRAAELSIAYKKLQQVGEELQLQGVIKLSEKKFRQLADLMPQIVWTATPDGLIDYNNNQWFEYTGFEEGHSNQNWIDILHADDVERWQKFFNDSIKTGDPYQVEFRLKDHKNSGIYRWFLCRALPVKDSEANITRWIGTCTDINDAKRKQEELQQTEQRRADFLKMVSHELKTPVTSIKGYVQLLLSMMEEENENSSSALPFKSSLTRIDSQVKRLTRLITEMLDLSRIESGKLELQKETFSLDELLAETIQDIIYTNTKHTINISVELKASVYGDKDRVEQVIINLINNAIKYSPGSNAVEVRLYDAGNNKIGVSIKDYGIGIIKEDQEKIFERFYRAGGVSEQNYSGFGIGLFIAKEIIQRHNGQILVESEQGKGSVFTFILPLAH